MYSLLCVLAVAAAAPVVQFAFNEQLPPVARYGEAYTYTLNSNTFSGQNPVTYSAPDLPSWLKFDASSMTLQGTPPASDKGNGDQLLNFTLQASDYTGTLSAPCQLQLSALAAPQVQSASALESALAGAGHIASNSSLILTPGQQFELKFPDDFFTSDARPVIGHYSVTDQHAPLPIWLNFDGQQGRYWGTAPSVTSSIAQAEKYGILYIVSTYQGFESAAAEFNLLVGAHSFATNLTTDHVNVTVGESFDYAIPFNQITLNSQNVTRANVSKVDVNIPQNASWLHYTGSNATLTGTPPKNAANSTFDVQVEVHDLYQDTVSFAVSLNVLGNTSNTVFSSSTWAPVNVTAGKFFAYSIKDYVREKDAKISLSAPGNSWLAYRQDNYTVTGVAPDHFNSTIVHFNAKVDGKTVEGNTASLTLLGVAKKTTKTSATSSSSSATASATSSSKPGTDTAAGGKKKSSWNHKKTVALACGLAIPLGLLAILALVLLFCCCRRRRRATSSAAAAEEAKSPPHDGSTPIDPADVSSPIAPQGGLFVAPVFKTISHSSGEDTMVETPEMKQDPADWTTPHRVSAYNFMRMDEDMSDDDEDSAAVIARSRENNAIKNGSPSAVTAPEGAYVKAPLSAPPPPNLGERQPKISPRTVRNATPLLAGGAGATAIAARDTEKYSNIPRESWRHTNLTDRRWQDARISYNSLGSLSPEEPATVRLVNEEFVPTMPMARDESSGILHYLNSDSTSPDVDADKTPRVGMAPGGQFRAVNATSPEPEFDQYTTASSGDEKHGSSDDQGFSIRPFKDDKGDVRWGETASTDGRHAKLVGTSSVTRRPSHVGHKAPEGHAGELAFV